MSSWSKDARRHLSILLTVALIVSLIPAAALAANPQETEVRLNVGSTDYIVNGAEKEMDVAPFIENGRTFVPIRFVAAEMGLEADWGPREGATEWVHLEKEGLRIEITIGDPDMLVVENGVERTVTADVAAQIQDGRTFLPLRALGQVLGADFDWGPKEALTEWVSFTLREVPVGEYQVDFRVYDTEEAPLAGATVELDGRTAVTDAEGRAGFANVAAGSYGYSVHLAGYATEQGDITVEADTALEVTLQPEYDAEVADADELQAALDDESVASIVFAADIAADVTAGRSMTIDFADYTLEGDVVFELDGEGTSELLGSADPSIDGDLTVDTPNASFVNNVIVSGEITVDAVAPDSYTENADGNSITINAGNATITITGNPDAVTITETADGITITVAPGAEVKIDVDGDARNINVDAGEGSKVTLTGGGANDVTTKGDGDVDVDPDPDPEPVGPGTRRANFRVGIDENDSKLVVQEGQDYEVVVNVENTGRRSGTQDITAEVGGGVRATHEGLTLGAGAEETVSLTFAARANDDGAKVTVKSENASDSATLRIGGLVRTAQELQDALADSTVRTLRLGAHINYADPLVIERDVTIDLRGRRLTAHHILVRNAEVVIQNGELVPDTNVANWYDDGFHTTIKYFVRTDKTGAGGDTTSLHLDSVRIDGGIGNTIGSPIMILVGNAGRADEGQGDGGIVATDSLRVTRCNLDIPGQDGAQYAIYTHATASSITDNDFNESFMAIGIDGTFTPTATISRNDFTGVTADEEFHFWIVPFDNQTTGDGSVTVNGVNFASDAAAETVEANLEAVTNNLTAEGNTFGNGTRVLAKKNEELPPTVERAREHDGTNWGAVYNPR